MEFDKAIIKWRPIIEYNNEIKNTKLINLYSIFLEWNATKNLNNFEKEEDRYPDLQKVKRDTDEKLLLYTSYKEVKVFLNEFTGQVEYMIDGKLYTQTNNVVTEETIIQIFGDDFYNFLIEEKYDFKK